MTKQPERNLVFEANYSLYLEEMTGTFNRRCNQFCSFTQLFLGASVFASTQLGWLFGFIIAFVSAMQFGFKFGEKAGNAKAQANRYRILIDEIPHLSESEIIKQIQTIEKSDTQVLTSLYNPARKRASIAIHGYDLESKYPLTTWERIISILSGGIPK
ncbi:MAG TPA: hypothetical protein ACHBZA_13635 [Arsenophonus apicola]|uniref:hypothetical protein n=1 Tax=Arsenophonus TaxID=637 RepID=UPI0015D94140|nr:MULTISPECIES: hypothetical protein [Arsenophonus]UBX29547.1 hypothetical protein LDL57_02320 [Arsenophonus apicola]